MLISNLRDNSSPYNQTATQEILLNRIPIKMMVKPHLEGWKAVPATSGLLAKVIPEIPSRKIIHFGCGLGALSVWVSRFSGEAWVTDLNIISLSLTQMTLKLNSVLNCKLIKSGQLPEEVIGQCDLAIIELQKGRKLNQRWLAQAYQALQQGGNLFIAGPNDLGIASSLDDARSLFKDGVILGYKKGCRAARFKKHTAIDVIPEWYQQPGIAPGTWVRFNAPLKQASYSIYSLPGVFSYDRIDDGTQFLINTMEIQKRGRILDLGCGNGLIGIAASSEATWVDMVDSNLLAIESTLKNIANNQILNARSIASDVCSAIQDQKYDMVFTNPPFHSGKSVEYHIANEFIYQAHSHLVPGGRLWVVSNRFIPYDRLMNNIYGNVELVSSNNKYKIFTANKL
jgi:16S rRNA (guanine1207-N2)-methyltransferase